ncbi:MAG: Uma2 family endonuclease [Candidatus Binatia bacterium]
MPLPQQKYTPEEYLALERQADHKSEYYAGEIFAMSGASETHNLIAGNIFASLHAQFRGRPCRVYMSDMRVKVSPTGLYTYPDVVAVCGERQFDDVQNDTLLNPTVIIEVLSPSTEAYDRGNKAVQYRQLPSLAEHVLVSQERRHVEHYVRQPDGQWLFSEASEADAQIELPSLNASLVLAEIYENVSFDA